MIQTPQLATLMVAAVFSAVLFVSGQLFTEYRSTKSQAVVGPMTVATRGDAVR